MKTITISLAIGLLFVPLQSAWAELTNVEKNDFVREYRKRVKLAEEFPEKQEVKVIFVDLDFDGKEEALATSYGSFYETGWDWAAFKRAGAQWVPIQGYDSEMKIIRPGSGVYARAGEIFRVTKNDGPVEFLILAEHYDKLAPEGKGPLNKTRFYLDKDGVMQQESIKDLERYLAYRVSGHKWPEGTLIKGLEAMKVEIFKD